VFSIVRIESDGRNIWRVDAQMAGGLFVRNFPPFIPVAQTLEDFGGDLFVATERPGFGQFFRQECFGLTSGV
jgi:hypothetical protein